MNTCLICYQDGHTTNNCMLYRINIHHIEEDNTFLNWQISRMTDYERHVILYSLLNDSIVRNLNNEFNNITRVIKEIKETVVKIEECSICYNNMNVSTVVELNCNHQFCVNCVNELFKLNYVPMCALCREPIKNVSSNQEILTNI